MISLHHEGLHYRCLRYLYEGSSTLFLLSCETYSGCLVELGGYINLPLVQEAEEPDRDGLLAGEIALLEDIIAVTAVATGEFFFDLYGVLPVDLEECE